MTSENDNSKISLSDFNKVKSDLASQLAARLDTEVSMSEFENELVIEDDSDLWDGPVVDSKAVVKLSPIVEEMTGVKIKPEWIRSGGYDSVEDAINDLIGQLELEFNNSGG